MSQNLFSEINKIEHSNDNSLVWKSSSSNTQSKIHKDFTAILRKHQLLIDHVKKIDDLLIEATKIHTNEIAPEHKKQDELELEKFVFMLEIYISDKLNLKGRIKETYRIMLLDICHENYQDFMNGQIYRDAIYKLETTSEKQEREYEIRMAEKQMKSQYGVDVDLEEITNADLNDEVTKEKLKEKYKDFFEKQQAEFENEVNEKFEDPFGFGFRNKRKTRKKTAKQLEKEKQAKEVEDLLNKDINKLFKELAKIIHPDREQDPELRDKKENLMKQLSNAKDNMNIGEIIYIKLLVDELVPENGIETAFNDDTIKRFSKIIKQKIQEIEIVNSRKLYDHPLFCGLEFRFITNVIAKVDKLKLREVVSNSIIATQNDTKKIESQLEMIKQKPKLIKDFVRSYEQEHLLKNEFEKDDFFDFLQSVKYR
jgi:hypothetical protein